MSPNASPARRLLLDAAKRERAELQEWVRSKRHGPRPLTPALNVLRQEHQHAPINHDDGGRRGD